MAQMLLLNLLPQGSLTDCGSSTVLCALVLKVPLFRQFDKEFLTLDIRYITTMFM